MKKISMAALFLSVAFNSTFAHAGEKAGNGGGAWVCREINNDVRWVKFVDLFEAEGEFGLTPISLPGTYTEILDQVLIRLFKVDRNLYERVAKNVLKINYLKSDPPHVQPTLDTLEMISDSLYRLKPNVKRCAGGILVLDPKSGKQMIPYEQVVNFKNDGNILVQTELFNKFTEIEKAALVLHEAIYLDRRETSGDDNSVVSRKMVGLLFSTLAVEEVIKQWPGRIQTQGNSPIPGVPCYHEGNPLLNDLPKGSQTILLCELSPNGNFQFLVSGKNDEKSLTKDVENGEQFGFREVTSITADPKTRNTLFLMKAQEIQTLGLYIYSYCSSAAPYRQCNSYFEHTFHDLEGSAFINGSISSIYLKRHLN